jgi:hypothetical protein
MVINNKDCQPCTNRKQTAGGLTTRISRGQARQRVCPWTAMAVRDRGRQCNNRRHLPWGAAVNAPDWRCTPVRGARHVVAPASHARADALTSDQLRRSSSISNGRRNRLVAGLSPAGPTTHSHRLRVYLGSCIYVINFKGLAVFVRSFLVSWRAIFARF